MDTLDDQFHCFIQVLDTLGLIDEHVGALNILDIFRFVFVHSCLDEDDHGARASAGSSTFRLS